MDFEYSSEQRLLSESVGAFVERELLPHEEEVERAGRIPPGLIAQIKARSIAAGFYALNMPAEHGGGGLTHLEQAICEFQFGRASRALQMICNRPAPILKACQGEQIENLPQADDPWRSPGLLCVDRARGRVGCALDHHLRQAR